MRPPLPFFIAILAFQFAVFAADESAPSTHINARMMQMPAVSATQIAFVYAGDIWIVPKSGGPATRLTTTKGAESFPRFSPDGTQVAFSGNYEGNTDLYVIPVDGGEPLRITHHGDAERMLGWYPDGKSILFESEMTSFTNRVGQLYKVAATGGLPEKLPVPYGEFGAISPDGKQLAYTTISTDFATWKRYRGGMAPDIWLFDLETLAAENVTDNAANDSQPMWHGSTLYFLSDRDAYRRENIWAYNSLTKTLRQVTKFTDSDIRFPSIGPDSIVFENGGRLSLLDISSEQVSAVDVTVVSDRATLRPRVENVGGLIRNATLSPTGKRALFEARGEIFSVPVEHGVIFNLTESSGVAERYPAWSPDGKWIAYFSDRTGEYELTVRPADSKGPEQTLTRLGPGWRYQPYWSPDSHKVVFIDSAMRIHLHDLELKKTEVIGQQLWHYNSDLERFQAGWSPDSRWLTYAGDTENRQTAIILYDTRDKRSYQVTSGFLDDDMPVFDPDGKYLYYRTKRWFDPIYSDYEPTWVYANGQAIIAVPLRKDVPSPLAPRNDDEKKEVPSVEEKKPEEKKDDAPKDDKSGIDEKKPETALEEQKRTEIARLADIRNASPFSRRPGDKRAKPVEIDIEGFESRAVVMPPGGGVFNALLALPGKILFTRAPRSGSGTKTRPLSIYDLEKREEKVLYDDASQVELSADGKKLLVSKGRIWEIIGATGTEGARVEKPLATGSIEMTIDPPAEWQQLFNDAWRIERDFFYDPGMHGVNWKAMRERYGKLMEDAVTRWDVNHVLGELLGELSVSHAYRGGGDVETPAARPVGYLGCDFALQQGAYRIASILDVAPWEYNVRAPLRQPGLDVKAGDWLLAVNGRPIDTAKDPWAAFQGLADKPVFLTVNGKPSMDGAREILVQTLESEATLRASAWREENRRRVDKASNGRIGYIYVPNTGIDGQNELYRQFRAQFTKPGLIIDERWNSGGQIPDRFIELLGRRVSAYWGVRDGHDWQTPQIAHNGSKAILANGWSGSGGDCFPWLFSNAGLGPIIGQRTWGGLIGMTGAPLLIDGGHVTVPTFSIYDTNGEWVIEGHGVDPDIAVVDDPAQLAKGIDPQLERAIEEVLGNLKTRSGAAPKRPIYPNRAGTIAP
ncbi:MAG: Periplasmic protease [Chthoniobacteraceae bacterium]|nr:Periplasmic protease [Chthoniobacteraceae bacterium]